MDSKFQLCLLLIVLGSITAQVHSQMRMLLESHF